MLSEQTRSLAQTKGLIHLTLTHQLNLTRVKLAPDIQHLGEVLSPMLVLVQRIPSASWMATILEWIKPLLPSCISLMHLQTFFLPNFSLSISLAFARNHSFFVVLTALLASPLASQNFKRSSRFPVPSHLE